MLVGSTKEAVKDPTLIKVLDLLQLDRAKNSPPGYLVSYYLPKRYKSQPGTFKQPDKSELAAWRRAEEILQSKIAQGDNRPVVHVLSGVALIKLAMFADEDESNMFETARHAFREATRLDPGNRDAWWGLTLVESRLELLEQPSQRPKGEVERSIATFNRMLQLDPDNELALVNLGIAYTLAKRKEEAIKHLERLFDLSHLEEDSPIRFEAVIYMVNLYKDTGERGKAKELLEESISDFEKTVGKGRRAYYRGCPYQALGDLYEFEGNADAASRALLKGYEVDHNTKISALALASKLFEMGQYQKASLHVEAMLSAKASDRYKGDKLVGATVLGGVLSILRKNYKLARKRFSRAEAAKPREWGVKVGRGHLKLKDRRYEAATGLFQAAIEGLKGLLEERKGGDNGYLDYQRVMYHMAHLGMAWAAANRNEHSRAIKHFDEILKRNKMHLLALQGKGVSSTGMGNAEQAERIFRRVLSLSPKNRYALAELGIVKLNAGELDQAEALFNEALAPGHTGYTCPYEGLGLVYLRRGQIPKAKEKFKKAINLNPNIEYKKFNGLARIYIKEGKLEQAKKLLRKSIENHPYDDEARELLKGIGVDR